MQNAAILPDHDHDIDIKTNFRIVKRKYSKENQALQVEGCDSECWPCTITKLCAIPKML